MGSRVRLMPMALRQLIIACCLSIGFLSQTLAVLNIAAPGENEVLIYYNDVLLFSHSESSPMFKVGKGLAVFLEDAGNFKVNETVLETVSLHLVTVDSASSQEISVTFESEDSAVQINFSINETISAIDGGDILSFSSALNGNSSEWNRLWVTTYAEENEMVYGAGEQYSFFNLRGYQYPIWTREQGVGRDFSLKGNISGMLNARGAYHTTYYPQASFFSSRKYFLLLDNRDYLILNFLNDTSHEIYLHNVEISGVYLVADAIRDLVPRISKYIGLQPVLPDWVMSGIILGVQQGTEVMMMRYNEAKAFGINVTAMWIQDWSGKTETNFGYRVYWHWKWNETYYPGLDVAIQDLLEENVRVAVYCNPHLIEGSELFLEADAGNHFLTDSEGNTYLQDFGGFMAGTIDMLDKSSMDWFKSKLQTNILGLDIGAWMADFGEYTRTDMYSKNTNISQQVLHNSLPVAWAQANREFVEENGSLGDVFFFMRAGGRDSSRYQVMAWAGDQNVDFSLTDGVATTILAALSLGLSGMGITHFDIGGYTTQPPMVRTEELLLRSAEYAVFTPVMRTHEGNQPENNFQYYSTNSSLENFARLSQIHSMLFPYTKALVEENANEGVPAQRPMFYHYENDPASWDVIYQYMYGPDLIVAPVINRGQGVVSIYIPEGDDEQWFHFWGSDGPYIGPMDMNVTTPMGCPVVFYRGSSPYATLFQEIDTIYGDICQL